MKLDSSGLDDRKQTGGSVSISERALGSVNYDTLRPSRTRLYLDFLAGLAGLVASFNQEVGITGAILTKLDGDSRGGAALSVKEV